MSANQDIDQLTQEATSILKMVEGSLDEQDRLEKLACEFDQKAKATDLLSLEAQQSRRADEFRRLQQICEMYRLYIGNEDALPWLQKALPVVQLATSTLYAHGLIAHGDIFQHASLYYPYLNTPQGHAHINRILSASYFVPL